MASGYTLEKIHATKQLHEVVDASECGEERELEIGWDWRVGGEDTFQVFLSLESLGTKQQHERVLVAMVGTFGMGSEEPALDFREFAQYAGPAILLPYIRQIMTDLTARGPFEPQLLAPVNMREAMDYAEFENASGFKQLQENPDVAARLGIEL